MKFRDHLQDKIVVYDCLLRCIINLLESFSSNAALVGESKAEIVAFRQHCLLQNEQ